MRKSIIVLLGLLLIIPFVSGQSTMPTLDMTVSGTFEVGTTVYINLDAEPSEATNEPVSHFWVYVYYGDPQGTMPVDSSLYIFDHKWVDANSQGDASVSFTVPNRNGKIAIQVHAVDEAGRTSYGEYYSNYAYGFVDSTEYDTGTSDDSDSSGTTSSGTATDLTDIAIVVGLLAIIIVGAIGITYYLVTPKKPLPPPPPPPQ